VPLFLLPFRCQCRCCRFAGVAVVVAVLLSLSLVLCRRFAAVANVAIASRGPTVS